MQLKTPSKLLLICLLLGAPACSLMDLTPAAKQAHYSFQRLSPVSLIQGPSLSTVHFQLPIDPMYNSSGYKVTYLKDRVLLELHRVSIKSSKEYGSMQRFSPEGTKIVINNKDNLSVFYFDGKQEHKIEEIAW